MRIKSGNVMTGDVNVLELQSGTGVSANLIETTGEARLTVSSVAAGTLGLLTASVSPGATTVTVDYVPAWVSALAVASGSVFCVIDKGTITAELRRITSVASQTLTLNVTASTYTGGSGLQYTHAIGATVVFVEGDVLYPWTWWGGIPNGSTSFASDNVTGFNRLTQQIHDVTSTNPGKTGVYINPGNWSVDNRLLPERDQVIRGAGEVSKIVPTAGFPFDTTGDIAVMTSTSDGNVQKYDDSVGTAVKQRYADFQIECGSIANSCGMLLGAQQPGAMYNVRIVNSRGLYSLCLVNVQDFRIDNLMLIGWNTGLRMRGGELVYVRRLNLEQGLASGTGVLAERASVGGQLCRALSFYDVHAEHAAAVTDFDFQMAGTVLIENYYGTVNNGSTMVKFSSGNAFARPKYKILMLEANGGTTCTVLNDQMNGRTIPQAALYDNQIYVLRDSDMLEARATLDFPNTLAQTGSELTVTVNGAVTGDTVYASPDTTLEAGLTWDAYVSATDTVTIRVSNITVGAINPASRQWYVVVHPKWR